MKEEPYWKYCLKGVIDFIRWGELVFIIILFSALYIWLGWWGIVVAPFVHWLSATSQGGAMGDIFNEFPNPTCPPNVCSAGIKGCEICNNEYSHEFNLDYNKSLKWYQKIV